MENNIQKTLFGNYTKKSVDEYISNLEYSYEEQLRSYKKELEKQKSELENVKKQEQEIGEAILHAKMLITQSREEAQKQAEDILNNAHREYKEVQESMLSEIDKLTEKRKEAEYIYMTHIAEIRKALDVLVFEMSDVIPIEHVDTQQEQQNEQIGENYDL